MWSKTPRQTIFQTNSQTPGPGAYHPVETRKTASHTVAFNKQPERFKREDSSLSTCSSSTANSARSVTQAARCAKLQERLRTFEVQIRERDQIISRLKMDKAAVSSRCQVLMDAYKQLRRVSVQSIPSQKLPKDISQEIMRMLSEEKQQSKDETRPSMNEKEIKDQMATFIVEMEQTDDPRIVALDNEKAALEVTLEEAKKRIEALTEEKQKLKSELEQTAFEIGRLTGSLRASESKDAEIKRLELQLQRSNELVDSVTSNATMREANLLATLKELGDAKATLASTENTVVQLTSKLEENKNNYEQSSANLKAQIESKENTVEQLEQKLSQLALSLRSSQDEREKLAQELGSTVDTLDKFIRENGDLSSKSSSVEEQLTELRHKCKVRKAELAEAESRLLHEKDKCEKLMNQISTSQHELSELHMRLRDQQEAANEEKRDLQNQLHQSQDNFERQLDEARKMHDLLSAQKTELEGELKLAVNRMMTLEKQVQRRDELLAGIQEENAHLQEQLAEAGNVKEDLNEQLSESADEIVKIRSQLDLVQSMESEAKSELNELNARCAELQARDQQKSEEIQSLRSEISAMETLKSELQHSLQTALNEMEAEREKMRDLENETASVKLLNLATTAELEQTKILLQTATDDTSKVDALKLELATAEAEKARLTAVVKNLEEQVESWIRVRDSLSKQLKDSEDKYQEAQETHTSQMNLRENNIKMLEEHLNSVKEAHEDELDNVKKNFERDMHQFSQTSATHLSELLEKFTSEKSELVAATESLQRENELLKSETESLIDSKASLSLQLQAKEAEVLHLRNQAAEADFYGRKCQDLESQAVQMRENVAMLQEDVRDARQELAEVQQALEHAKRANEAHAVFTLAMINSGAGGQKVEALQLENDNLRHQLSSLNGLLDALETGIETSEAKNSVYVKSYAQMQQQIQRLVGHSNNKQRIQYVGKLQTENRELKEEQAKLRSKVDAMQKKYSQMEMQLRKYKDKENRPDASAMSMTQSRF